MSRRIPKPTLLDRAIGVISPRRGLDRLRYRAALNAVSGYSAARRDRNATHAWSGVAASANADTLPGLETLRARSRDLVRNDPLAQSSIATKVVNVVGHGHQLRPELDPERLGMTPDEAARWEADALDVWQDWAQSQDCDVTRAQPFAGLEDLVYRSRLLSGDVFVIRRFKERRGRLLGTCFQVVEADRVSNPSWHQDTDEITGGIEMDGDGAPVAYYVADRHLSDRSLRGAVTWHRVPAFDGRGHRLVLHVHGTRWRPDMARYAPMLAPVIESLKQRSRYTEAELVAAVVSACFAIGMTSEDGDLGGGIETSQSQDKTAPEIKITEPGQIFDLMPHEKIQTFEPGRPNPAFGPFLEVIAQEVGAGTDLPHELLLKKFQASYSASRAAMEMAWQFFRADRAAHVAQFCQPAYEAVIGEAIARGVLTAPGFFSDPLRRRAWLGATWMGPSRPTIDPVKDAKADREYLDMGATTLTRITAERFGQDARDVRRRRALDGSNEAVAAAQPGQAAVTPPDDTTDEETT